MMRRNRLEKWLWSQNPAASAISASGRSVSVSQRPASSTLSRRTYVPTEQP